MPFAPFQDPVRGTTWHVAPTPTSPKLMPEDNDRLRPALGLPNSHRHHRPHFADEKPEAQGWLVTKGPSGTLLNPSPCLTLPASTPTVFSSPGGSSSAPGLPRPESCTLSPLYFLNKLDLFKTKKLLQIHHMRILVDRRGRWQ